MSDETESQAVELYRRQRPHKLSEVVGQPQAVATIKGFGRDGVPHCLLLTGPSGCGKTTLCRILKRLLNCSDMDFCEVNIADMRGIDNIREIRDRMGYAPVGGSCRIWLLDETARMTTDAQNALLKILEDTPSHCYFMLATTEPGKLLATIKTRATEIKVLPLNEKDMQFLLTSISSKEDFTLLDSVRDKIVECVEGSPRKALVMLNTCLNLKTEEEQLAAVSAGTDSKEAIEVARALMNGKSWSEVSKLLKAVTEEPETVRRIILGYFSSVLLGGGKFSDRAFSIIEIFAKAWHDSGKAGMVACCYEAATLK